MPLMKGKSEKAFTHNVRTEMHHDKPQKQALAIAYSMKRKAKKMAAGGDPSQENAEERQAGANYVAQQIQSGNAKMSNPSPSPSPSPQPSSNPLGMARGGYMSKGGNPYSSEEQASNTTEGPAQCAHGGPMHCGMGCYAEGGETGVHKGNTPGGPGESTAGWAARKGQRNSYPEIAKDEHRRVLSEMKSTSGPTSGKSGFAEGGTAQPAPPPLDPDKVKQFEKGFSGKKGYAEGYADGMAEGGFIGSYQSPSTAEHQTDDPMTDEQASGWAQETHPESEPTMQGNTEGGYQTSEHDEDMLGRIMHKMSKGGQVANDTPITAGFKPNQFDDLVLRNSDMEGADYTGGNSGDEDGVHQPEMGEEEKQDRVARVMMKRARQRNPGVYKGQVREG